MNILNAIVTAAAEAIAQTTGAPFEVAVVAIVIPTAVAGAAILAKVLG